MMKISSLIAQLATMIQEHGDIDVYAAKDAEVNHINLAHSADVFYINVDDPECIYDCQANAECDAINYEPIAVVFVQ